MFDEKGKYYFEMNFGYSTRIDVRECTGNRIIYNTNVYDLEQWFFDEQDNLYIVHQGYIDKVDLLTGDKKIIVDLSKIAENKGENRVGEDYVFVNCSLIQNSNYLVGIVYEPPYNYNRIYMFDMDTGEIVAMSNSVGEIAENGYAAIIEKDEIVYVFVAGKNGNSLIRYPLQFDSERKLIFDKPGFF